MNKLTQKFLDAAYAQLDILEAQMFTVFKITGRIPTKVYDDWKNAERKLMEIHGGLI